VKHIINLGGWLELGRFLKAMGGWEHPDGEGLVSAAGGGGSTFPRLRASRLGFYLHAKWIFQLFPPTFFQRDGNRCTPL